MARNRYDPHYCHWHIEGMGARKRYPAYRQSSRYHTRAVKVADAVANNANVTVLPPVVTAHLVYRGRTVEQPLGEEFVRYSEDRLHNEQATVKRVSVLTPAVRFV